MDDRRGQPLVAVVACHQQIIRWGCLPTLYRGPQIACKAKEGLRVNRRDLCIVYLHRVVIGRGTKTVALGIVCGVAISSRVNQPGVAVGIQLKTQRVVVTMPTVAILSVGASVHHHIARLLTQEVDASICKGL